MEIYKIIIEPTVIEYIYLYIYIFFVNTYYKIINMMHQIDKNLYTNFPPILS